MIYQGKQKIWSEYQKEIPDDHWFYVRSCIRQNFFPGAEVMFMKICRDELGKDIYETASHTTCGGIAYHCDTIPQETVMTIVARQFALMTEAGYENYVASCITSFGNYIEILETWNEFPEVEAKIRELLWKACRREFNKPKYIAHASDLVYKFRNDIAARARFRLVNRKTGEPLRVVEHIGCHYSKMFPSKGVGGAEYPYEPYHPDMIITNCPGCPYFMDRWQYAISEIEGKTYGENGYGIPVFTYEEVAGLVLGYDPWDLGLQLHQVAVEPLLDKIGIPYDPEEKYKGLNHKDIMRPELPGVLKCC